MLNAVAMNLVTNIMDYMALSLKCLFSQHRKQNVQNQGVSGNNFFWKH